MAGQNDKEDLEEKVNDLVREFGRMTDPQQQKLEKLAKQAKRSQEQLQNSLQSLQESLDYLRICIKYQMFDLEATRRENRYLRRLLDDKEQ